MGVKEINKVCPAITPSLGAELWDADAAVFTGGTYSWEVYGANTIANDGNQLRITYVNHAGGAYDRFANERDLSTNLTVGTWYKFQCNARVQAGNSCTVQVSAAEILGVTVTETNLTPKIVTFQASHATNNYARLDSMAAGEIGWLDDLSLKSITFSTSLAFLGTRGKQNGTYQCTPTVAIASQCGMAICYLNATNLLLAYVDQGVGKAKLDKLVAGTWTSVISGAITYGATNALKVIVNGTNCSLYYNGAQVGATTAVSEIATLGKAVYGFNTLAGNSVGTVTTTGATS